MEMSSRMFWVAVGAVGGVVVYRRGQRVVTGARERGVVGNVAVIAGSVARAAAAIAGSDFRGEELAPRAVSGAYRPTRPYSVTPVHARPQRARVRAIPATALRLDGHRDDKVIDLREVRAGTAG